jgi:hypothetical protein
MSMKSGPQDGLTPPGHEAHALRPVRSRAMMVFMISEVPP